MQAFIKFAVYKQQYSYELSVPFPSLTGIIKLDHRFRVADRSFFVELFKIRLSGGASST